MALCPQFRLFAAYNALMNRRMLQSVAQLDDQALRADRGAFFGSVLGTLNHTLVGDLIWLKRFAGHPAFASALAPIMPFEQPASLDALLYGDLDDFGRVRETVDSTLTGWIDGLSEADTDRLLTYHDTAGTPHCKHVGSLISHLFLHQTHHRGQITTLLSQVGIDFGETDILEILPEKAP